MIEEPQPPSRLLHESAGRWLDEHGIDSAQLRLPFDLRYGDATIPSHFLRTLNEAEIHRLGDYHLPQLRRLFEPRRDNAGNLQLFTLPIHAANLLDAASRWLFRRDGGRSLDLDGSESDAMATAILRVSGLWKHCTGKAGTIRSDAYFDLLIEFPLAHQLTRLLLRADRVTDATRDVWHQQIIETIGDIYHTVRVIPAVHPRRDAWLRLLRIGCVALRL